MREEYRAAFAILAKAMKIEQEGRRFYLKAKRAAHDEKGREVYAALADDEGEHLDIIKKQRDSLAQDDRWARSAKIKPVILDLQEDLFPPGKKAPGTTGDSHGDDRDALLVGIDIETRSYDLYRRGAQGTADPLGRQIFEFLADQARSHFNVLMLRYESLFGSSTWYP